MIDIPKLELVEISLKILSFLIQQETTSSFHDIIIPYPLLQVIVYNIQIQELRIESL